MEKWKAKPEDRAREAAFGGGDGWFGQALSAKGSIDMQPFLNRYLGDKPFWRATMRLALPIALQNLLISSFTLVDTIMIGGLGDVALSAVGMAGQWSWMLTLVLSGFCSGTAVFISQYWGVGDTKGIKNVYALMLVNTLAASIVFFLVGFLFPEGIVSLFNRDAAVVAEGAAYLKTACFSYFALALSNTFSTLLRATENVRLPMYASGVAAVLNAVLNYGLIYGAFGLPEMGVRGAALATCISSWVNPLVIIVVSAVKKNLVCSRLREMFALPKGLIPYYYKVCAPVLANESLWGLGTFCYNIVFARIGYEYYAAVTIFRTIDGIAFTFFIGLCNACCVMVGKSIGAGRIERALGDARRFAFVVPILSLLVGGLIALCRLPLISLFDTGGKLSEVTRHAAGMILLIYGLEYGVRNIPYILIVGVFRSGGDTVTGLKLDLFCVWCIALPAVIIAAFVLKLPFPAVFAIMLVFEDALKVVFALRRFLSRGWIRPVTEAGMAAAEAEKTRVEA